MTETLLAILVGLMSGYLSGQFGIGGGLITTPGIRLLLGRPAFLALGTPLLIVIPTALVGALTYYRSGYVRGDLALPLGLWGLAGVVAGSLITAYVSAHYLMVLTAVIIAGVGVAFLKTGAEGEESGGGLAVHNGGQDSDAPRRGVWLALVGLAAGFYSGLLGMGGGLLIIPALIWIFGLGIKETFGTSLVINSVYAVPGSTIHYLLGHVDLALAGLVIVGVLPGAYLGARVTIGLPDRLVRILFGLFMMVVAAYFAYFEVFSIAS